MHKAIFVDGKVVTGVHHGDAFSKLSESEKNSEGLISGFWDEQSGKFIVPNEFAFYTKKIILVRHSLVQRPYDEDPDPELSSEGHHRCCETARFLAETEDLSGFVGFTSPMLRCLETARDIQQQTGISFTVDQKFVEAFPPHLEIPNRRHDFPGFFWENEERFHIDEETPLEFSRRLDQAIRTLPHKAIIISHCSFIANMAELICGNAEIHQANPTIPAASITLIDNYKIVYMGKRVREVA